VRYSLQDLCTPSLENVTEGTIFKIKCRYEDKTRIRVKEVLNDGNWNQLARNGSSGGQFWIRYSFPY